MVVPGATQGVAVESAAAPSDAEGAGRPPEARQSGDTMHETATDATPRLPWRRRHPTQARLLLYGLGAALAALAVWLLLLRAEDDRQDRIAYLHARLDTLGLLVASPGGGPEALVVLEEEFADPHLPPLLHHRAGAMEAVVHARAGREEEALAALEATADLDVGPLERRAHAIQRAEVLLLGDREAEGLAILDGLDGPSHPTLDLLEAQLRAWALAADPPAAAAVLDAALEDLPPRLDGAEQGPWAGAGFVPAREAALTATQALAALRGPEAGAAAWRRLLERLPADLDLLARVARHLRQAGHEALAARAWAAAEAADAAGARALAARDAALADLASKR